MCIGENGEEEAGNGGERERERARTQTGTKRFLADYLDSHFYKYLAVLSGLCASVPTRESLASRIIKISRASDV